MAVMEEFNVYGELMEISNGYIPLSGVCGGKRYKAIQNLFCLQSNYRIFKYIYTYISWIQILGFANECIYVKLKIMVVVVICRIGLVKVFGST